MLWIADRSFGGGVEVHWWGRGLGGNRAPLRRTVGVRPIALIECLCMETTALSPTHCHTTPNQDAVPISYRAKTNAEWTTAEAIAPRRKLQTTVAAPQVRCGCLRIGHIAATINCNHRPLPLSRTAASLVLVDCTSAAAPSPRVPYFRAWVRASCATCSCARIASCPAPLRCPVRARPTTAVFVLMCVPRKSRGGINTGY